MNFDRRCIDSGYVIASDAMDDSLPYNGIDDPCVYFNDTDGSWTNRDGATAVRSEEKLATLLEKAKAAKSTKKMGYDPLPVFVEVLITSVKSTSFDSYVKENKRKKALAKLSDDDIEILGLER
jgi:hypothetical protein